MFALGLLLQGRIFSLELGEPLVGLAAVANMGAGLPWLLARLAGAGQGTVTAVTYEYGNCFLIVAGLLNFLVILDAFDIGQKKLTVQTEFFPRPTWRLETKVYLGGALKKVYTEDMTGLADGELQRRLDTFHDAKIKELVEGLKKLQG